MLKRINFISITTLVFSLALSSNVHSAWDAEDVNNLKEKLKNHEKFNEDEGAPNGRQILIRGHYWSYGIDFNLKDCFILREGITPYSCKKIKQSFPVFAPLITWE